MEWDDTDAVGERNDKHASCDLGRKRENIWVAGDNGTVVTNSTDRPITVPTTAAGTPACRCRCRGPPSFLACT